ncbi:MAG: hypothetical protein MUC63_08680 [Planctomycetes bacterium]|nr:hypothetical protein [Planctomycetota bacterium]
MMNLRVPSAACAAAFAWALFAAASPASAGEPPAAPALADPKSAERETAPAPEKPAKAGPVPANGNGSGAPSHSIGKPSPAPNGRNGEKKPRDWLVLTPRTVGYRMFYIRVRAGSSTGPGTGIHPERDVGMDNSQIVSPDINLQLSTDVLGLIARFQVSFNDDLLYGIRRLSRALVFRDTVFPAGIAAGFEMHRQRVQLRYVQEITRSSQVEIDAAAGSEYFYFRNRLNAPGFARQEVISEFALPSVGFMAQYAPVWWGRVFIRAYGFYWNLGRDWGQAGSCEASGGASIRFTRTWGFILGFSFLSHTFDRGYPRRTEIRLVDFGPELAITATLF